MQNAKQLKNDLLYCIKIEFGSIFAIEV